MRHYRLLFVLLALLVLPGCAQMVALQSDPLVNIDDYAQQGEYGRALDTIEAVRPSHPDYERARARLLPVSRAADAYAERVIENAQALMGKGEWQPALDAYDEGLRRYRQSRRLAESREAFLAAREAHLADLDTQLLINRAEYLLADAPLYARIEQTIPKSYRARRDNQRHQQAIEDTAARLYTRGMDAMAQKRPELAEQCLSLAHTLAPNDEREQALEQARRFQVSLDAQAREERARRIERQRSARITALMENYRTAMAGQDLLRARAALDEAARLQPGHRDVNAARGELEAAIDRYVSSEIERGRRAYTLGNIEEALEIWQPLQRYSPDNRQLNEHIERATRVLENVREIEQRQPSVTLP
ncbi:MAG TPA: hypothetical protein ENN42_00025 [Thioalkalivibrio sp.]|nr:hypothetical protein [Thioalkalivibrio sp.]